MAPRRSVESRHAAAMAALLADPRIRQFQPGDPPTQAVSSGNTATLAAAGSLMRRALADRAIKFYRDLHRTTEWFSHRPGAPTDARTVLAMSGN